MASVLHCTELVPGIVTVDTYLAHPICAHGAQPPQNDRPQTKSSQLVCARAAHQASWMSRSNGKQTHCEDVRTVVGSQHLKPLPFVQASGYRGRSALENRLFRDRRGAGRVHDDVRPPAARGAPSVTRQGGGAAEPPCGLFFLFEPGRM